MLKSGEQSDVKVRLLVDASGRVTKCTSLSHFKAPEFNQVVCANFTKRARFEPAELADGTKVPSYYATQIHWRIAH
jgi:protein TonB